MAEVKPEIKVDSVNSPKLGDIDEFEEDTDLHFPSEDSIKSGAWLVKVPEDMWKAWNDTYQNAPEDEEIEVGKLRVYHAEANEDVSQPKIQIRMHESDAYAIPKIYNIDMKASKYNNIVVFSEKDLPGHRAQPFGGQRNLAAGGKPSGIQLKSERYGQRRPGSYRTAIPKQTTLAPPIFNEAVAKPVDDDSSLDFFKKQYDAAMNAGQKVTFSNRIDKGRHPGLSSNFTFGSITSKPGKGNKKKVPKEKAVRKSKEVLLDELYHCFKEFKYWSLKALRGRLHQPEVWIKEVLEEIAILMRAGDFTGNYRLNDNTARILQIQDEEVKAEVAPVKNENESDGGTGDEMGDGDDDDGPDDFEDVDMKTDGN